MHWRSGRRRVWALLAMGLLLAGRGALAGDGQDINAKLLLGRNGNTEAQYALGGIYGQGTGVNKDAKQAAFWYTRAAMAGHADAQYRLGLLYDTGEGVPQSYSQALDWYGQAADQGHQEAEAHRQKIRDHIAALKGAAGLGQAEAQLALADLYAHGNGVAHDDELAVLWYRKAAEQGAATGQYRLGLMYAEGRGVSKDDSQAVAWYRKAAEQGQAEAQYALGGMYYRGKGVAQDATTSYAWLSLAASQGLDNAIKNKAFAASRLTPDQLRQAQTLADELQAKIGKRP